MKSATTIQERLWKLRRDRGLNLEELTEATGILKSALGSYESNDYKEINHGALSLWQIFMKCLSIICFARQKTGSRPTRL